MRALILLVGGPQHNSLFSKAGCACMQLCSLLCPQQHQQRPRVIVQNRSRCLVLPSNPPHGVALDLCCNERGWRGEDLGAMAAKHASLLRLGVGLIARMQSRATQSASPKRLECISPPPGPRPCPCDVPCGECQVKTPMGSRGQELVSLEGRKQGRGGCWPSCASSLKFANFRWLFLRKRPLSTAHSHSQDKV